MKALLLHPDRDFDLDAERPRQEQALVQDLELERLLAAVARNDPILSEAARAALLAGFRNDAETIRYRQAVLADCLAHPAVVRGLYSLAVETLAANRDQAPGFIRRYPAGLLREATGSLRLFLGALRELRRVADAEARGFSSAGFARLFRLLQRELTDEYFATVERHLAALRFDRGVLLSARLGPGNQGCDYKLRELRERGPSRWRRLFHPRLPPFTYRVPDRDEAGARALSELRDRGIPLVADALAQSAEHLASSFATLRTELAFYAACLNLEETLRSLGAPVAIPQLAPVGSRVLRCAGLYDVTLALAMGRRPVGNDLDATGKNLVAITGANQGRKSAFLRGLGLAQLLLQAGGFVAAESFAGELSAGLFTHYGREEDATTRHGKLDEELARMSEVVDGLAPEAWILCNESFASTNEREGSEIARQVVRALLESRIRVFFVTHLFDFAHRLHAEGRGDALFLRAERLPDGTRTFKLREGEPLETSHGADLYAEVFGEVGRTTE